MSDSPHLHGIVQQLEIKQKVRALDTKLSQECIDKANKVFDLLGPNENDEVDEERFVNHWNNLQARISALDFFAALDDEQSGALERDQFLNFWHQVKQRGTSDDEIIVLLEMTELGEMWIGFDDIVSNAPAADEIKISTGQQLSNRSHEKVKNLNQAIEYREIVSDEQK